MTCGQLGCNDTATHKVYWPGNYPILTCEPHARMAEGIANGLGIYVHIEDLPYEHVRGENVDERNNQ